MLPQSENQKPKYANILGIIAYYYLSAINATVHLLDARSCYLFRRLIAVVKVPYILASGSETDSSKEIGIVVDSCFRYRSVHNCTYSRPPWPQAR